MEFKGTKGTWEVLGDIDYSGTYHIKTIKGYPVIEEDLANAQLISAAPELLEACQLMLMDLEERGKNMQGEAVRIMKDAIKKALGGE